MVNPGLESRYPWLSNCVTIELPGRLFNNSGGSKDRGTQRKCGKCVNLEQKERRSKIWELKKWIRKAGEMKVKRVGRKVEESPCWEGQTGTRAPRGAFLGGRAELCGSKGYSGTQGLSLNKLLLKKHPESYMKTR